MIEFLSGAVTVAYLIAAGFFLRYWRKSGDRLFMAFAAAFVLFALNQFLGTLLAVASEANSLVYVLRVLGFAIIIAAVVDKNVKRPSDASRRAPRGGTLR